MDADRKRELKNAYKTKAVTGGVVCYYCKGNGKRWIFTTRDTDSLKNRFNFSVSTKSCPDPSMRGEWAQFGVESFTFSVLEELKKGENQTDREFTDDLNVLRDIWLEKAGKGEL